MIFAMGMLGALGCGPGEANPPKNLQWNVVGQDSDTEIKVEHKFLESECPNQVAQIELSNLGEAALDWEADWPHVDDAFGEQWAINKVSGVLSNEGPELLVLHYRCQPEESDGKALWLTFFRAGSEVGTVSIDVDVKVAK
jgi:hypothetical protein